MSNSSDVIYLVRAGKELRDPSREQRIVISPPNATPWLPPIFERKPFVVPYGRLAMPIDMDGKPIHAHIAETHEEVTLYPKLRIEAVEKEGGGEKLAAAVCHAYERQLPELRERIDGIFRAHVGLQPDVARLERIWSSRAKDADDIEGEIRSKLGLLVSWTLEPEPTIAKWAHSLMRATPVSKTLIFNPELPSTTFSLAFSLIFERIDLSLLHKAKRRAGAGLNVTQEIERLFQRVHEITNPAFRSVLTGINIWNSELIRELAIDGFGTVVARRLQNENGYKVRFSDFAPEPNQETIKALKETSDPAITLARLQSARQLVATLQDRRTQALLVNDGDFDATEITNIDKSLVKANSELADSEREYLRGNQRQMERLAEISEASNGDLRKKFQDALRLEEASESRNQYGGGRAA